MVYMEIKPGYNSVWVMGDSERITVITHRSSTDVFRTTITRNPKFLEKVFPACYEQGLFLLHPTEEKFRTRIKRAISIAMESAENLDEEDRKQELKIIKKREQEIRNNMDLDAFVESFKQQSCNIIDEKLRKQEQP
jgi:hypothetical protein